MAFLVLVKDPEQSPNPALRLLHALKNLPKPFRRYLAAAGLFGVGDFSHSLLILAATQLLSPSDGVARAAQIAGALYVWRNIVQIAASYPTGVLADRYGSMPVLVGGYALGVITAILTAGAFVFQATTLAPFVVIFGLGGLYMAVQEALESTVTADIVDPETLATSYGALGTVNGTAKFISSTAVGLLWTAVSPEFAFGLADSAFMLAGTFALGRLPRR